MYKYLLLVLSLLLTSSLLAMSKKQPSPTEQIDDWEYNATIPSSNKHARLMTTGMVLSSPMMMKKSIGFSVGGAKDADNFYENIKQGYLPKLEAMTYEGVFYDHYFKAPKAKQCKALFCPAYSSAISQNPFTEKNEYYLAVGLDSHIKQDDFARKRLNIVVVLDISGSMSSPFNRYYYDQNRRIENKEQAKSKMQLANEAIVNMSKHLGKEDSLGVILFDNQAYHAKPLRPIKETNMDAIRKHILALKPKGGTNWSAGYKAGIALFDSIEAHFKDPKVYENRIIFLTDAMPNRGELHQNGLFALAKNASNQHIYTTFIGIGVDFNNDLVEAITKTKGANYYAIHSSKAFKKRLDEEFDYMVTPLVFDLKLHLKSDAFAIEAVYGSPDANRTTGTLMYVNTLFPSPSKEGKTRGGVILLKLKKIANANSLKLSVSYHDRAGKAYHDSQIAQFKNTSTPYHDNRSIQKAILLSRYVDLMKNFTMDMRKACNDRVSYPPFATLKAHCGLYPPTRPLYSFIKTWERKSCPLEVSPGYQKIFALFSNYFKKQLASLDDNTLHKELSLLETLQDGTNKAKIDDWKGER